MIENNYNILPKLDGEIVNFITNVSSKIYKNNTLVSDFPIGDFSIYVDSIYEGFYIKEGICEFVGVSYFLETDYVIVTSNLGDCIEFNSSNKTRLVVAPTTNYNTITVVLELTNWYNYLFFVWDDRWDILYKEEVSTPGQVWSKSITGGYYILYIDTATPPITTIEYGSESDEYSESLIVFYAEGSTTVTFSDVGSQTIYLRSLDINEFFVKTTLDGLYIYSKKTRLGPFKFPINTQCVMDFECFIDGKDTIIYVYCNYFLIGSGKLYDFNLNKSKPISFNMTSIDLLSTILSAKIYSFGLFTSKKACPASVYDICCRSISSPVVKANIYDDNNLYVYKTDYSVWVLDYYNNTLLVLYGDNLKKSTLSSLYNNLMYAHDNYTTVSYGFSLSEYRIVDVLYNKGVFILLLEDRLVIIDKLGTVLRYIYCKNISKLFYIDNYVLFYDKTRARLYRVYSDDFKNFELPSVLMTIDFGTRFRVINLGGFFNNVSNSYVSVIKEQSVFGYRPLYDYLDIRTYTVGSHTESNLVFEYDLEQRATKFTGIMTSLGYRTFANNPIENPLTSFTLFVSIKPMSLQFKRYIIRIPGVLDVYMVDGILKVDLKCVNADFSIECSQVFNVNTWYDIYITYNASTGLYIYVNGFGVGKVEFKYDTGGTLGQKYIIIGGYVANSYSAYKFKGFIRNNLFIVRSFITEAMALYLNSNTVRGPQTFSKYNTYVEAYGVTSLESAGGFMFVGAYDGLYVYETSTFKLVKIVAEGSIILGIESSKQGLFANSLKLSPIGEIKGSSGEVVKIQGELYGKIFMAGNKVCYSCVYDGYTYVKLLDGVIHVLDASKYFGDNTVHGYYNLGKFSIDTLTTEIQLTGEFGYDEQNDKVVGDTYINSTVNDEIFSCCDIYTSTILYTNIKDRLKYDAFLDIEYRNETTTIINLFGIVMELNDSGSVYTFIASRYGSLMLPYESISVEFAEYFSSTLPCRLYHSEDWLLNLSQEKRLKMYFDVSADNFRLLKERKVKVLENYIESSSRFTYDFRGGLGNGVMHQVEDGVTFGCFSGLSYFINSTFEDVPLRDFSAEFILRINSRKKFNPIFSKSTKSKLSYGLALYGSDLKFLFGQDGVNSILDLKRSINLNQWTFIAIYVSDVYIDVFVDGDYSRVLFYGNPDVVESELYVGFGISLNSRAGKFVGDMLYFDINKSGTLSLINADYTIYTNSKAEAISYDEVINLDEYYNINDNVFKMTSTFFSPLNDPITRYFQLYDFYMIGYDDTKTIVSIEVDPIFPNPLLRKLLKINTDTLEYSSDSFSNCIDFTADSVGGLYSLTASKEIQYSLDDITNIDKFKYITTIKYVEDFVLFGTLGGIVKVNGVLSNDLTKQYWLLDNGVTALLVTDEFVYIASGKCLGFVQIEYLKTNLEIIITRDAMPLYVSDTIIKSVVKYDSKTCILSGEKIIDVSDDSIIYSCGDANSLFSYKDDVLIIYDNYIQKLSNKEIILTVVGKITDISYGDVLVVSTSSGFYIFDEILDEFVMNLVGITGILKEFNVMPDYCYHVYMHNNGVIYIYRDFTGIKLAEFNIDNNSIDNDTILYDLVDGSFSDFTPPIFNSIGK